MPSLLIDLLYVPLAVAYFPFLLYQMLVQKKNRRGWGERFGAVPRRRGGRPCVWIHGVSLGEINATPALVAALRARCPDCDIVISSTTDTGYAAARRHYPAAPVFRYPLDFSWVVRRVIRRIRPDVIVLMELELWPNLLRIASRRGIAVGIANGRITEEKSMRRFNMPIVRHMARDMVRRIDWIAAQDETYAARFRRLYGAGRDEDAPREHVFAAGSLKYDTAVIADEIDGASALAEQMGIDRRRPLVVAGSTGPGEEAILLRAYAAWLVAHPDLQLAIIPRKPERFDDVARQIAAHEFACVRRSLHQDGGMLDASNVPRGLKPVAGSATESETQRRVFLGDTMGELRKFYSLATIVFVGRSLVHMGGSDLIEVAALAKPMCYGPHVENFADVDRQLRENDAALQVTDEAALTAVVDSMLRDIDAARMRGARARQVVLRNQGATQRVADLICESLSATRR